MTASEWVESPAGWSPVAPHQYTHLTTLSDAAARFIAEAQAGKRIDVGIPQLDEQMRGIGAGHLALFVGYSHSGKTQLAIHTVRHNADKRVLWYSPDEPPVLLLTKFASATWGVPAKELEQRVHDADPWALQVLGRTIEAFPDLLIIGGSLTPRALNQAYTEACEHWGAEPELVVVDFLDLLQVGDRSGSKAEYIKAFTTEHAVPTIVLHQTSRSAGARGQAMGIASGNYGGETVCMYQIGVWRKRSALLHELGELAARSATTEWSLRRQAEIHQDLAFHRYTITVNLSKNKRPGGGLIDEVDLEVQLDTGALSPLNGGMPSQLRRLRVVGDDPYHRYETGEVPW